MLWNKHNYSIEKSEILENLIDFIDKLFKHRITKVENDIFLCNVTLEKIELPRVA